MEVKKKTSILIIGFYCDDLLNYEEKIVSFVDVLYPIQRFKISRCDSNELKSRKPGKPLVHIVD